MFFLISLISILVINGSGFREDSSELVARKSVMPVGCSWVVSRVCWGLIIEAGDCTEGIESML